MASLLSFAFIALAFGLIDSAPVPGGLAYFNINPLGDIQGLYKPGLEDEISPFINEGYNLGLYGEPYLLKNAAALGEDGTGFPAGLLDGGESPLDALGGLGGGIGDIIGGGTGGILDGGSGGILGLFLSLAGVPGGILDGGSGGILDGGSGGILDGGASGILDGGSGGILDGGSGGILDDLPFSGGSSDYGYGGVFGGGSGGILDNLPVGGGSGGILDNLPVGGGSGGILDNLPVGGGSGGILDNLPIGGGSGDDSLESLPDGGIPAGDGTEYLIGNYDEQSYSATNSSTGSDYAPYPTSDSFNVPSASDPSAYESGNSSNPPGADVDGDTYGDYGSEPYYSDATYYEQSGGSDVSYYEKNSGSTAEGSDE